MSDDSTKPKRGCALTLVLVILAILVVATGIVLSAMGYVRPFLMPTAEMVPAISNGDHVMMETFTYRSSSRKPQRGDVVVFSSEKTGEALDPGIYILRIAGLPGDTLRLEDGKLIVNDKPVNMTNIMGKIHYETLKESVFLNTTNEPVTVPEGSFFLLGDNSTATKDSRFWGFLPAKQIMGKISFCFWPVNHIGIVK